MTAINRALLRPSHRRLRIFTLDPSLQTWLDTSAIGSVEISIPWEKEFTEGNSGGGTSTVCRGDAPGTSLYV